MSVTIQYETCVEGDVLHVTTSGFNESMEEVRAYGEAIIAAAKQHGCMRLLIDERNLDYRIDTVDIYDLASYYAQTYHGPAKVALVANKEGLEDARFWETAVRNRGLLCRIFTSKEEAQAWLGLTL